MAHENVAFDTEKQVEITSFSSRVPSSHTLNGEANHTFENENGTDNGTKQHELPKPDKFHIETRFSSARQFSVRSKLSYDGRRSFRKVSSRKLSTMEMEVVATVSKNGEKRDDRRKDSDPNVTTKTMVKVTATDRYGYESSQILFYVQIAFFAMCGCLCRIGSDQLFGNLANIEEPGQIVNQSFFSNIFGSFVLGALNGSPMGKTRLAALYKGLTTGFCGSFTTWSKWNQQLSLTLIGETSTASQTQVMSIASWFIGFYSYIGSYCVGIDFGKDIGGRIGKHVTRNGPKHADIIISCCLLLAVIGFALGVAFDSTEIGKGMWLAVLFAPFGACLRAWLAQFKVERIKLPLGTLLANLLGALILAAVHVINVRVAGPECNGWAGVCWPTIVTYGVGTGFCACLTTISTFMSEIYKLRPEHPIFAYSYAIMTVVICQILCGIINGVSFNQPM